MTPRPVVVRVALAVLLCGACGNDAVPVTPAPPTPGRSASPTPPAPPSPPAPPPPTSIQDDVTGEYVLALDMGSGCDIIPADERTRTYSATITSARERSYLVTLTTGRFLSGGICTAFDNLGCHQFEATRQDEVIRFDLANNNDEAHGGHIVEQLAAGSWVEIFADARGRRDGSTIEASGEGSVWYCRTSVAYPFPCSNYAGCESSDMRLRFTRK